MKDEEYFNDKLFVFSNDELKETIFTYLKEKSKKEDFQTPLYMFVDEALREKLKKQGVEFNNKPGKPILIKSES